jgi:hypothetical protein
VQAGDVFRAIGVVEDVEQRTVEDGVVTRLGGKVHRVGDLEPRPRALGIGIAPGLLDRLRREIDAEHVVAEPGEQDRVLAGSAADVEHPSTDQAGPLQFDDRRLRFADHPRRGGGFVELIETRDGGCRIHD